LFVLVSDLKRYAFQLELNLQSLFELQKQLSYVQVILSSKRLFTLPNGTLIKHKLQMAYPIEL
jgi:hypothetical protein